MIILKDGKFLVNRKKGTDLYIMPGGKPEKNESAEQCMARELKEEHDCELITSSIKFVKHIEHLGAFENVLISMELYKVEINGTPRPNSEIEEQKWFGKNDDPNILSPLIKNEILPLLIEKYLK